MGKKKNLQNIINKKKEKQANIDDITVQKDDDSPFVSVRLNLDNNLSDIRKKLKEEKIEMNGILFAKNSQLTTIASKDEVNYSLKEIIEKKTLYLVNQIKIFEKNCKLGYGRTITLSEITVADEKAFEIKTEDCKMEFGTEGSRKGSIIETNSEEGMIIRKLYFMGEIDVYNFAKFELKTGRTNCTSSKSVISSDYRFSNYKKVSLGSILKSLQPTKNFIGEVKKAINSPNPRKSFQEITEKYGRFISDEVILGGKVYFKVEENSNESSKGQTNEYTLGAGYNSENSNKNINYSKCDDFNIIGGKVSSFVDFNENEWFDSLEDYCLWRYIGFEKPVSIFEPLPEELYRDIFLSIGKKILYFNNNINSENRSVEGTMGLISLREIPQHILEIIENKNAECSIFATVDTGKKSNVYNCQILWEKDDKPKLMIHCLKKSKKKLEIGLMVIGYDINFDFIHTDSDVKFEVMKFEFRKNKINSSSHMEYKEKFLKLDKGQICVGIPVLEEFNYTLSTPESPVIGYHFFYDNEDKIGIYTFSYCLKEKHYVNLPDFNFYTLIINHPDFQICDFSNNDKNKKKTKYISIYSVKDSCGPCGPITDYHTSFWNILKRNSCESNSCICRNQIKSNDNLKYPSFDPGISFYFD
jgi:hypothetical protein